MTFMYHIQISLNIKKESTSSYSVPFHLQLKVEAITYKYWNLHYRNISNVTPGTLLRNLPKLKIKLYKYICKTFLKPVCTYQCMAILYGVCKCFTIRQ
jgi:hypothetical protein